MNRQFRFQSFLIKNELLKYEEGVTGKEEIKYPEKIFFGNRLVL